MDKENVKSFLGGALSILVVLGTLFFVTMSNADDRQMYLRGATDGYTKSVQDIIKQTNDCGAITIQMENGNRTLAEPRCVMKSLQQARKTEVPKEYGQNPGNR